MVRIYGRQEVFHGAERDRFGQDDGLPEFHLYFAERISVYDFFVFQVMEEGFQGGDFPFDCFGLIFPVESGNVRFEYRRRDFMDACEWNKKMRSKCIWS